jgi:hypothetical protein
MSTKNVATQQVNATVVNGPSAADIVNSLLYAYGRHNLPVRFTVDWVNNVTRHRKNVEFDVNIVGVIYESGSPGMFIIKFYIVGLAELGLCEGFYNANRRTGTLAMTIPEA